ncbi:MAG: hypothetical protein ISS56_12140 [Anaerolineae bacterium]|nr:hypothetical protein [Anaerolineae bacterium]
MLASRSWEKLVRTIWKSVRDFALTIGLVGGGQVLVSLLVWPLLFRSDPLGFSLSLSLVGFASWLLAFVLSFGDRRRSRGMVAPVAGLSVRNAPPRPVAGTLQAQVERSGCGFVLLVSSVVPLGLAFALRLQADLQSGKTWSDIFPPMPLP